MSKAAALQNALNGGAAKASAPVASAKAQRPEAGAEKPQRQANRADKWNLSAWVHPAYKKSLRLVQLKEDRTAQELISEAMNMLFEKYNVPTISDN